MPIAVIILSTLFLPLLSSLCLITYTAGYMDHSEFGLDYCLANSTIFSMDHIGLHGCIVECYKNHQCNSVNYHLRELRCELNDVESHNIGEFSRISNCINIGISTINQVCVRFCTWWAVLHFIANWLKAKTIIFRYFLARYRNFLPQVDQKVHQVLQNLPQAFCIGDVIRYDSIKPKNTIKSKICKIIIKLYISENLFKK